MAPIKEIKLGVCCRRAHKFGSHRIIKRSAARMGNTSPVRWDCPTGTQTCSNNPGSKQGACRHGFYKRSQVGRAVDVLTSLVHTDARLSRKTKTNLKQFTGSDY